MTYEYHGNCGDVHLEHESRFVFIDEDMEYVKTITAGPAYWRDDLDEEDQPWYEMTDERGFKDLWTNEAADSTCDTEGVLSNRGVDPDVLDMSWKEAQEELPEDMLKTVLVTRAIGLVLYHGVEHETYHDTREELEQVLQNQGVPEEEIR